MHQENFNPQKRKYRHLQTKQHFINFSSLRDLPPSWTLKPKTFKWQECINTYKRLKPYDNKKELKGSRNSSNSLLT